MKESRRWGFSLAGIAASANPNENSETEVHISRSPDGGFVLDAVLPPGEEVYYDSSRLPRTTYYFKLRAVRGELTSDFSGVKSFTTGSKFYHPILTAEAIGPGTIELKLYDRSYNDLPYQIFREGPGPDFNQTIVATDSGKVFQITDDLLEPNTTYNYRVDAYTKGPNMPRCIDIVNTTVTTPEGPQAGACKELIKNASGILLIVLNRARFEVVYYKYNRLSTRFIKG